MSRIWTNYYEALVECHRNGGSTFTDGWQHYTDGEIKDQAHKFLVEAELPEDRIGMLHDLVKCYCYRPDEQEPGKYRWMPPPF